jgi:HemY protein
MRKIFALILIALLLGVGVVAVIETDPGYLLVAYGNYTLESSLWVGLLLLVVLILVLYAAISLIRRLLGGRKSLAGWWGSRRSRATSRLTTRGIISFNQGNWARARRQLLRGARNNEAPLDNYLMAARASYHLGESDKIQEYLGAATDAESAAGVAVELARAELKLQAGEYQQALGVLESTRPNAGRHPRALDLLRQAYLGLGDWEGLLGLLPDLKKHKVVSAQDCTELEREAYRGLLQQSAAPAQGSPAEAEGADTLRHTWQKMPGELKRDTAMMSLYASKLVSQEAWGEAEKFILRALKQQWDPKLVSLYGYVQSDNVPRQLAQAESWLGAHPTDPGLLLCLGRLCARDKLWGKARDYFESSYRAQRSAETCAELGRLLSAMGEDKVAAAYYREGLMMQQSKLPKLPLPDKTALHQQLLARS